VPVAFHLLSCLFSFTELFILSFFFYLSIYPQTCNSKELPNLKNSRVSQERNFIWRPPACWPHCMNLPATGTAALWQLTVPASTRQGVSHISNRRISLFELEQSVSCCRLAGWLTGDIFNRPKTPWPVKIDKLWIKETSYSSMWMLSVTSGLLHHKELQKETHFIYESRRFHTVKVKNSGLLIYHAVLLGYWLPTFRKKVLRWYTFLGSFENVIISRGDGPILQKCS
jgi:hypothetical protein